MSTPSSDTPAVGTETATPATGWGAAADTPSTGWSAVSGVSGSWRAQLPSRVRSRPRAYGTGRYGKDRYDSRDDTRYAWGRIAPAITLFLGILIGAAAPARAVNSYCETADATTTLLSLCLPSVDVEGANPWGSKWNTNAQMIENEFLVFAASTGTLQALLSQLGVSTNTLNQVKASTGTNSSITQLTGLTTPLTVPQGGTGANSLMAHGLLIGEGASASTATRAMANGGLVIGAGVGVDPSTGTLTAGSAITVTNSAGAIAVGVDSSSAVVKSGGLILNSEIDGSSITKLSGGLIPNSLIDGSVVTKQGVGISSTGASAQFMQNMVVVGGLIKGGNFVAGGSGDAVLIATQTFSGSNTHLSTESFSGAVYGIDESTTIYNFAYSSGTQTAWAGCTMGRSSGTFTTHNIGDGVSAHFLANCRSSSTNIIQMVVLLDGRPSASSGWTSGALTGYDGTISPGVTGSDQPCQADAHWINVSSGSHTACIGVFSNSSNTWSFGDAFGPNKGSYFRVWSHRK